MSGACLQMHSSAVLLVHMQCARDLAEESLQESRKTCRELTEKMNCLAAELKATKEAQAAGIRQFHAMRVQTCQDQFVTLHAMLCAQ